MNASIILLNLSNILHYIPICTSWLHISSQNCPLPQQYKQITDDGISGNIAIVKLQITSKIDMLEKSIYKFSIFCEMW